MNNPLFDRTWRHLRLEFLADRGILFYYMQAAGRPCFTLGLLDEIREFQLAVQRMARQPLNHPPVRYLVLASDTPGVFNLGGDLARFRQLIGERDRDGLYRYAMACIDVLYRNAMCLDLPLTTISMIEGQALGGGLEAGLSSSVVVAERTATLGFPEILFNLFPGMGAYHLLCRRISAVQAERFIQSGRSYTGQELHALGLVDILAEEGQCRSQVLEYIRRQDRAWNGYLGVQRVRLDGLFSREDLVRAGEIWVEAALSLTGRDLRKMEKLVAAQDRLRRTRLVEGQRRAGWPA